MLTKRFMNFCIQKYIRTHGDVCRQLKIFILHRTLAPPPSTPTHTVLCNAGRSGAVVPVLFLFCVALSSCFFILFSIVIALLGEGLVCVLLVHLFVCFVRVSFCHFSLPLGVGSWL